MRNSIKLMIKMGGKRNAISFFLDKQLYYKGHNGCSNPYNTVEPRENLRGQNPKGKKPREEKEYPTNRNYYKDRKQPVGQLNQSDQDTPTISPLPSFEPSPSTVFNCQHN